MKKELITFDQLAALSFLKFVKLDDMDMTLLIKGIKNIANIKIQDDSHEYFLLSDGTVILEKRYIEKFAKNVDKELFESIDNRAVIKYLDNLNINEFVLRKIKLLYPCCSEIEELVKSFSSLQMRTIKNLYKEGYIQEYLYNDSNYGDYKAIKLTKRGEVYLYLIDNKKEIEKFIVLLQNNGYDITLIELFLNTQNLEKSIEEILTLNNFITFYDKFHKDNNQTHIKIKKQQ